MPSRPEVRRLSNALRRSFRVCTTCGEPAPNGVLCDRHLEERRLNGRLVRSKSKFIPVRT